MGRPPNGIRPEEVLRAAAILFARNGYAETTMQEVAESLKISKPTLYAYAKGKRQILQAIVEKWMEGAEDIMNTAIASPDKAERIPLLVMSLSAFAVEHGPDLNVFLSEEQDLPRSLRDKCRRWSRNVYSNIRDLIVDGQSRGSLRRDIDPSVLALTITSFVTLLPRWYEPKGRLPIHDVVTQFMGLLTGGTGARKGS